MSPKTSPSEVRLVRCSSSFFVTSPFSCQDPNLGREKALAVPPRHTPALSRTVLTLQQEPRLLHSSSPALFVSAFICFTIFWTTGRRKRLKRPASKSEEIFSRLNLFNLRRIWAHSSWSSTSRATPTTSLRHTHSCWPRWRWEFRINVKRLLRLTQLSDQLISIRYEWFVIVFHLTGYNWTTISPLDPKSFWSKNVKVLKWKVAMQISFNDWLKQWFPTWGQGTPRGVWEEISKDTRDNKSYLALNKISS